MQKLKIALLYGGKSAEHEVSVESAKSVYSLLNRKKYKVFPIYITHKGLWFLQKSRVSVLKSVPVTPCIDKNYNIISQTGKIKLKIDVFFPVLHGPFGEDGTMQGMLELIGAAYVGSPPMASSVGMDKIIVKMIAENIEIPVSKHIVLSVKDETIYRKVKKMGYPVFVKPVSLGSSVGVTKANDATTLKQALQIAFGYDRQVMVEKAVENAREIVCAVLGTYTDAKPSLCGEVVMLTRDFYDYESKYIDTKSHDLIIPARLDKKISDKIRKMSVEIFKTLKCSGLARVDFLIDSKTKTPYFCEINTIPGLTANSLYPKLWETTAIKPTALMDKLIKIAIRDRKLKI